MGREQIGASNRIGIKSHMYSYCWRNIQPTPSSYNNNLSLCKFLKYSNYPYIVGSNRTTSTNFGVGTYLRDKGYLYFLKLHNTTNCTIEIINGVGGKLGYKAPWFDTNATISTASSTGTLGYRGQFISNTAQYFNIRATAGSGYTFSGWYTAASGGSVITTSTNYNAYYNFSDIINRNNWYARTATASYIGSTAVYYGSACVSACTTTYPIPSAGGPNIENLYWSTPYSPQSETQFSTLSGPFYRNSSLTGGLIVGRSYSNTYVCRIAGHSNSLGSTQLCEI